jgi:putative membrane protein
VLVFRTNSSFARLVEARVLLGNLVRCVRDLARLSQYIPDAAGSARREVVGYAAAVGYACGAHVRRGRSRANPDDPTAFRVDASGDIARILGEAKAAEYSAAGNRPMYLAAAASRSLKRALEAGGGCASAWMQLNP